MPELKKKQIRYPTLIAKLERKLGDNREKWETLHMPAFNKHARYLSNGIVKIGELYSNDTRELFLMYIVQIELEYTTEQFEKL